MANIQETATNQNQNHANDSPVLNPDEQIFVLKFARSAEASSQFNQIPFLFRFVDEAIIISPAVLAGLRRVNLFPDFLLLVLPQFMAHREQIRKLIARYDQSLRQTKRELVAQKLAEAALTHGDVAQKVLANLAMDHYETFQLSFNSLQILGENARALESIAVDLADAFITNLTYVTESFPRSLYESFLWQNDSSFKSIWRWTRWVVGSCDFFDFNHHKILIFDFYTKCVPIYRIENGLWVKKEEIEEVTRMLKGRAAVKNRNYSFQLIRRPFQEELGVARRRRGEMDFESIFINVTDAILRGGTPINYFGPDEPQTHIIAGGGDGGNVDQPPRGGPRPGGGGGGGHGDEDDGDSGNDDDDNSGGANGGPASPGGSSQNDSGGGAASLNSNRAEAIEMYTQAICGDQDKILRQLLQKLKTAMDKILKDCQKFPDELPIDFKNFMLKILMRNQIIQDTDTKLALASIDQMTHEALLGTAGVHDDQMTLEDEKEKKLDHHLRRIHAHKGTVYPDTVKKVKKIQAQVHHELSTEWVKTISHDLMHFAGKIMTEAERAGALKILEELMEKELDVWTADGKLSPSAHSILKFALESSLNPDTGKPEWWPADGGDLQERNEEKSLKKVPNFDEKKCSFSPHPDLAAVKEILEEIVKENNLTMQKNEEKPPSKLPSPSIDVWLKLWGVIGKLNLRP